MRIRYEPLVYHTVSATTDGIGDITATTNYIMNNDEISVVTWDKLKLAAEEDSAMVKLMEVVMRGFPQNSYEVDDDIKPFHKFRYDLHVADGVVCYKDRIVVPAKLREQLLETIHAAHQGVTGMMGRVEDTVGSSLQILTFWFKFSLFSAILTKFSENFTLNSENLQIV